MKAKEVIELFAVAPFKARHGDVVIVRDDAAPVGNVNMKGVIADGEATGHAHRVSRAKVLAEVNNLIERTVVVGNVVAKLSHEEHKTSPLPPMGKYRTGIQKQYSPAGWTRVID